jgi:hypothetical protein
MNEIEERAGREEGAETIAACVESSPRALKRGYIFSTFNGTSGTRALPDLTP